MTKLHDMIREFLEDVQTYLLVTLNTEILSANALSRKEGLLMKIQHIRREIPSLIKVDEHGTPIPPPRPPQRPNSNSGLKNPAPYLDMHGSVNNKPALQPSPIADHKVIIQETNKEQAQEEDYETYDGESEASLESSYKTDTKSVAESEDIFPDDGSGNPEISAVDLVRLSDKNGFLEKKGKERLGGLLNPFQRRWCAIRDGLLLYYDSPTDRKQRGSISLVGYEGRHCPSACKDPNKKASCFEIVSPGKRTYHFVAYSTKDMKQWISAIERNSKSNSTIDLSHLSPKLQFAFNKPLPPIDVNQVSVRPKAKAPLPIPLSDEEIYEVVEDMFSSQDHDDEPLYEEGASWRDSGENEEIYIDTEGERPKGFPENLPDFKPEEWYVGLWDCKPADETELAFQYGDLIRVVSKEYDKYDWWTAVLDGKVGFVPKAYLQEAFEKSSD